MVNELKSMIGMDETILYEGKPDKKCFIFESILNPLLPVAIIWAVLDMSFMGFCSRGNAKDHDSIYVDPYDAGVDLSWRSDFFLQEI